MSTKQAHRAVAPFLPGPCELRDQQTADSAAIVGQRAHWDGMFTSHPDMLGGEESAPARHALEQFREQNASHILELGGGQGRDTLFFAREGLSVTVLDFSPTGIEAIQRKVDASPLSGAMWPLCHDVRDRLPFDDATFDGCYSHMLSCMAFSLPELEAMYREMWRVLKVGSLNIFTVRNTSDAHYGTGQRRGQDLYESGGFIVHFFDRRKIEHLSQGFELVDITELEEGDLPRRLYRVTLTKTEDQSYS